MSEELEVKPLIELSEDKVFYVYVHKKPNGEVFYVGKGKNKRAWSKKNRNLHWKHVVEKYGSFEVEILKDCLTEKEAFETEKEIILKLGFENLTNQTLGGISTTGFRHSDETRKLQSEIVKERLKNNPELMDTLKNQLQGVIYRQRHDEEYRKEMSEKIKQGIKNMPKDKHQDAINKRCAWLKDEQKLKAATEKLKITQSDPEYKRKMSEALKKAWERKTPEEREAFSRRSSSIIMREDVREKLLEFHCDKIVVNRKFLFNSKKDFLDYIGSDHAPLSKAFNAGKKFDCDFALLKGYFVEHYNPSLHSDVVIWNGEELRKLDLQCFPRSKAVTMDDHKVFLSLHEASRFCNGKSIEATADFITKNIKLGKPAMGHQWRVSTNLEIKQEILKRVLELYNEQ